MALPKKIEKRLSEKAKEISRRIEEQNREQQARLDLLRKTRPEVYATLQKARKLWGL